MQGVLDKLEIILPAMIFANFCLSMLANGLKKFAEIFKQSESPFIEIIGHMSGFLQKVIDFLSANVQHK